MKNAYKMLTGKSGRKIPHRWRTMFKWILEKLFVKCELDSFGSMAECGCDPWTSIKVGEFLVCLRNYYLKNSAQWSELDKVFKQYFFPFSKTDVNNFKLCPDVHAY